MLIGVNKRASVSTFLSVRLRYRSGAIIEYMVKHNPYNPASVHDAKLQISRFVMSMLFDDPNSSSLISIQYNYDSNSTI